MALATLPTRAQRFQQEESGPVEQFVSFRIGEEEFGIDILLLQEIIRVPNITPVPNAPHFVLGMINLRGRIIPVIDLRQRLLIRGVDPRQNDKKTRILIVEMHSHVTGFIVDSVSEVLKVPVHDIEPTPHLFTTSIDNEYIKGVVKLPKRLITLLDFERILKPQENKELQRLDQPPQPSGGMGEEPEPDMPFNARHKDKKQIIK
jgi:purine-binding chemotaxis protein CheW